MVDLRTPPCHCGHSPERHKRFLFWDLGCTATDCPCRKFQRDYEELRRQVAQALEDEELRCPDPQPHTPPSYPHGYQAPVHHAPTCRCGHKLSNHAPADDPYCYLCNCRDYLERKF